MTLPTNLDATYPDAGHPSRSLHQQHHDTIHATLNDLPSSLALSGMALLSEVVLAAGAFAFTSIPATYRSLMLVIVARSNLAAVDDEMFIRFNADSGASYDWQALAAYGTTVAAAEQLGGTYGLIGRVPAPSGAVAGIAGVTTVMIPDYARTTWQKTYTSTSGNKTGEATGNIQTRSQSGFWRSTAVINRIDVGLVGGALVAGSVASLYGIRSS